MKKRCGKTAVVFAGLDGWLLRMVVIVAAELDVLRRFRFSCKRNRVLGYAGSLFCRGYFCSSNACGLL